MTFLTRQGGKISNRGEVAFGGGIEWSGIFDAFPRLMEEEERVWGGGVGNVLEGRGGGTVVGPVSSDAGGGGMIDGRIGGRPRFGPESEGATAGVFWALRCDRERCLCPAERGEAAGEVMEFPHLKEMILRVNVPGILRRIVGNR